MNALEKIHEKEKEKYYVGKEKEKYYFV